MRWDIFCKVIDNHGDIGVCWRLAADLATRGQQVRLWVDGAQALTWMAPGALQGRWPRITVMTWEQSRDVALLPSLPPADVWVEGFGCDIAPEFLQHRFNSHRPGRPGRQAQPIWINLEYLSAEHFAQRSHGLPSPVMQGPAKGCTKHFYYPGFAPDTGGLLREPELALRQASFDRAGWLATQGIRWHGERLVSLYCYEPQALADLLAQLCQDPTPTRLLVTHGRAAAAVEAIRAGAPDALSIVYLPALAQRDFDHLLWSCDINFVRGEDSLVRAIWAGKPFVWQIYPQHDDAHHAKLQALLDALAAPRSWRYFHAVWNGIIEARLPQPDWIAWSHAVLQARDKLMRQTDLITRLLRFVETLPPALNAQAENR